MKSLIIVALFVASMAVSGCHYGQSEAQDTLGRNEQYKGDKAEYSVNRAGEGGQHEKAETPAVTTDTSAKATAPAADAGH